MDLIKKILAPTDLSPFSSNGIRYAYNLAREARADLIFMNVLRTAEILSQMRRLQMTPSRWEEANLPERLVEHHKRLLSEFLKRHLAGLGSDLNIREVVETGEPHTLIVKWAKEEGVDLIIMSTHGRSGLPRMMLGSVTEKVLRSASCPVLAIPSHDR